MGFPMMAAKVIWIVPSKITAPVMKHIAGGLDRVVTPAAEGFLSFLMTSHLFNYLQLAFEWQVPLLLIMVTSLWKHFQGEDFGAWPSLLGIFIGMVICPRGLSYPSMPMTVRG
jgi:hypothetical protein